MKFNKWTLGLAALGVVSLASAARADEVKLSQVQTALSNTTLSGFVDVAAIWRPGTDSGPVTGGNPGNIPASAFSKNDGFYLNGVDLALDKPEDEGPWASGYHAELMLGPDSVPGAGIRQAYVTLRTPVGKNGLDWKVGVFDTVIGYESSSDPLNPNYTRSYGYSIEPTTHTGVLATFKANDVLTFAAGVADSSNIGTAPAAINGTSTYESQKTYLGTITFTAPDSFGALKGATLNLGAINSVDSSVAPGTGTKNNYYAGVTLPTPSSALKLGAAFDYLNFKTAGAGDVWVAGIYATVQPSDKLSFNFRGEIVDATKLPTGSTVVFANPGYAGHYAGEVTATMQYQVWANVLSRLEFRWDHVDVDSFGYSQGGATGSPIKKNDFLLALNLIYQF
jgi:hypothetical protein